MVNAFTLHAADLDSIYGISYGSLSMPEIIPEHRARSNPSLPPGVAPKPKKIIFKIKRKYWGKELLNGIQDIWGSSGSMQGL